MGQIMHKAKEATYIGEHVCYRCNQLLLIWRWRLLGKYILYATCTSLALDIALGMTLFSIMRAYLPPAYVAKHLLLSRAKIKDLLENLLSWLMGAPAGLKLNHELSAFMGNFFVYHVHIWMGYLNVLDPYLQSLVYLLTLSSCFGLTVVFSLGNDIVNLLTFHIYCFYAYAAKCYGFLLAALTSLARLFTGKKWNMLRMRVDSVSYETDQLVFGTILFTILLFLLPTVLLYYAVFMVTRLVILIPQLTVYSFVYFMHTSLPRLLLPDAGIRPDSMRVTLTDWLWKGDDISKRSIVKELILGGIVRPLWRSS